MKLSSQRLLVALGLCGTLIAGTMTLAQPSLPIEKSESPSAEAKDPDRPSVDASKTRAELDEVTRQSNGKSSEDPDAGTPNGVKLQKFRDQIVQQEAKAASLAREIRTLSKSLTDDVEEPKRLVDQRKELQSVLDQAFDLKTELEKVRIQAMQSRLADLERQVKQRQKLKPQIIARRLGELTEGDDTKWNSPTPSEPKPDVPRINSFPNEVKASRPAMPSAFAADSQASSASPSSSPVPSYKELAIDLATGLSELQGANSDFTRVERLFQQKVISTDEVEIAKRKRDLARRKYLILRTDYRATLLDMGLQLDAAQLEMDSAATELKRLGAMEQNGTATQQKVREAALRLDSAKIAFLRLKSRSDLIKEAGEGLLDEISPDTTEARPRTIDSNPLAKPRGN